MQHLNMLLSFNYVYDWTAERGRYRVVRVAWLWCRESPEDRGVEAGLRHSTTGRLSLSTQPYKWASLLNQETIRHSIERDGLRLSFAVTNIQWDEVRTDYLTTQVLQSGQKTQYPLRAYL